MVVYHGQIIAGGGTIVMPMTRAEYEANKTVLDSADVWVDLIDEPDQVAEADQIAYSVNNVQKGMGYIGDIATKAVAKVEPSDTALYLHEVGEYFINKDGDACKVDSQIPVNGTITLGTNCHVVSDGVANDINSNLSDIVKIGVYTSDNVSIPILGFAEASIPISVPTGYKIVNTIYGTAQGTNSTFVFCCNTWYTSTEYKATFRSVNSQTAITVQAEIRVLFVRDI